MPINLILIFTVCSTTVTSACKNMVNCNDEFLKIKSELDANTCYNKYLELLKNVEEFREEMVEVDSNLSNALMVYQIDDSAKFANAYAENNMTLIERANNAIEIFHLLEKNYQIKMNPSTFILYF